MYGARGQVRLSLAQTSRTEDSVAWCDVNHRAGDRKSTLVFCVNIAHVQDVTAVFREAGIDARFVYGRTAQARRKELVEAFRGGEFPVMVNCGERGCKDFSILLPSSHSLRGLH